MDLKSQQTGEGEVAHARARVGEVDLAGEAQQEGGGVLRDGLGRVRGHARHKHAVLRRRVHVHVVVPSAPERKRRGKAATNATPLKRSHPRAGYFQPPHKASFQRCAVSRRNSSN